MAVPTCAITTPLYDNASFPGILLQADTATEMWLAGVLSVTPYTRDADTFDVQEGGSQTITVKGTNKVSSVQASGNSVIADPGQLLMDAYQGCNTILNPGTIEFARIYLDIRAGFEKFIAMDLAKNSAGTMRVKMSAIQAGSINSNYMKNYEFCIEGTPALYTVHYTDPGAPDLTFAANTITDAQAAFVTEGFEPGMSVIIGGVGTPNTGKYATIDTVAAGLLTMVEATPFVVDAVGDVLTEVHAGRF